MVVDMAWKNAAPMRVASIVRIGPWKEDNLKSEFEELVRWAAKRRLRTGRWVFWERDHHRWEACLEVKGSAKSEGRILVKTLAGSRVASIVFDPERVSSRLVYHGLLGWTRQRRKDGTIRAVTGIREVYPGNPWRSPAAWAHCDVQFLVRK